MKYIVPTLAFLLSLIIVAFVVDRVLEMIFPSKDSVILIGIGTDWRNLLGTLFGTWAGVHSWKASLRSAREKKEAEMTTFQMQREIRELRQQVAKLQKTEE